ncbi:MAG: hypothetical protein R3B45_03205 [Bdellovibrionota bacterium]
MILTKVNVFNKTMILLLLSLYHQSILKANINKETSYKHWARSYLVSSIFINEYVSIEDNVQQNDNDKISPELWFRAYFALQSSTIKDQHILETQKVMQRLKQQRAKLEKKEKNSIFLSVANKFDKDINSHLPVIAKSLKKGAEKRDWNKLSYSFKFDNPKCILSHKIQKMIVGLQKNIEKAKSDIASITNQNDLYCILISLMSNSIRIKHNLNINPSIVIKYLLQVNPDVLKDETIAALTIISFMQEKNYTESLRVLLKLQEANQTYRFVYDKVQRIFSAQEKGAGKVSIRSL